MAADIALFPVLNDDLLDKLRFQPGKYEFFYEKNDEEHILNDEEADGGSGIFKIIDERGVWNPDENNLSLRRAYTIKNQKCLFGEAGIACQNAVLGIALMWTSIDSKQRGIIPVGQLHNTSENAEIYFEHEFKAGTLRGEVELTTVIYLKKVGVPMQSERHLANQDGYLLGELDKNTIRLDGTGSVFPIYESNEKDMPLWYVKCEWDEAAYDSFSEHVSIYINRAHKNFKYLDRDNKKTFNEQLIKEVMAGAIMIILETLKEQESDWYTLITSEGLQKGSVAEAIQYFTNALEWQVNSKPEALSSSIRKFLDERM